MIITAQIHTKNEWWLYSDQLFRMNLSLFFFLTVKISEINPTSLGMLQDFFIKIDLASFTHSLL